MNKAKEEEVAPAGKPVATPSKALDVVPSDVVRINADCPNDTTNFLGLQAPRLASVIWSNILQCLGWITPNGLIEARELDQAGVELAGDTLLITTPQAAWLRSFAASATRPLATAARFAGYDLRFEIAEGEESHHG